MSEEKKTETTEAPTGTGSADAGKDSDAPKTPAKEIGGRGGADPARFGDWEINGRCVDF